MEKKSLISNLKTTKKANVAASPTTNEGSSTRKSVNTRKVGMAKRKTTFRAKMME